jgi:probable rRNA maturation factor
MKTHPFLTIDYQLTVKLSSSERRHLNMCFYLTSEVLKYLTINKILPTLRPKSLKVSLLICGDKKIRTLNKIHRKKDRVTDVLSFPYYENLREMKVFEKDLILGDLAICVPQARRQSKKHKISFMNEFIHLFFHGMLHLLGYDHEVSLKEEIIMQQWEDLALEKFSELKKSNLDKSLKP